VREPSSSFRCRLEEPTKQIRIPAPFSHPTTKGRVAKKKLESGFECCADCRLHTSTLFLHFDRNNHPPNRYLAGLACLSQPDRVGKEMLPDITTFLRQTARKGRILAVFT
jgi:hypothetical protein